MISSVAVGGTMVTLNNNDHQVSAESSMDSALILVSAKTSQISTIGLAPFFGNFTEQIVRISFHDPARFISQSFLTSVTNRHQQVSDDMIYLALC